MYHVCIYVCMLVYVHVYVHMYECMYVYICMLMYVHMYECVHVCLCQTAVFSVAMAAHLIITIDEADDHRDGPAMSIIACAQRESERDEGMAEQNFQRNC